MDGKNLLHEFAVNHNLKIGDFINVSTPPLCPI